MMILRGTLVYTLLLIVQIWQTAADMEFPLEAELDLPVYPAVPETTKAQTGEDSDNALNFPELEEDEDLDEEFGFCHGSLCDLERPMADDHLIDLGVMPFKNHHHRPSAEDVKKSLRKLGRRRRERFEKPKSFF